MQYMRDGFVIRYRCAYDIVVFTIGRVEVGLFQCFGISHRVALFLSVYSRLYFRSVYMRCAYNLCCTVVEQYAAIIGTDNSEAIGIGCKCLWSICVLAVSRVVA